MDKTAGEVQRLVTMLSDVRARREQCREGIRVPLAINALFAVGLAAEVGQSHQVLLGRTKQQPMLN